MKRIEVATQAELDAVLARGADKELAVLVGDGWFHLIGDAHVEARGSSHVVARGSSHVVAWESSHVVAWESSHVVAWESSHVEAWGSSHVVAWGSSHVEAWESSHVVARESSHVEAWGSSHVVAWGSSHVEAWGSSHVEAGGSSHVVARESSHVEAGESSHVVAWGSSHVEAWGSSHVVAWESSHVVAWESSHVEAWESSHVVARESSHVVASRFVAVHKHSPRVTLSGGVVIEVRMPTTPEEWCDFYGVTVCDGVATVYKGVRDNYLSRHGHLYEPGRTTEAGDWDPGAAECGGGLHFSPHPRMTLEFDPEATRFIACPVALDDMRAPRADDRFPQKIKARRVCAPMYEVDAEGARGGE